MTFFDNTDNTNGSKFLSSLFGLLLSNLNSYIVLYEAILLKLNHFLDALDTLYYTVNMATIV